MVRVGTYVHNLGIVVNFEKAAVRSLIVAIRAPLLLTSSFL
jgi:hypothetical protein